MNTGEDFFFAGFGHASFADTAIQNTASMAHAQIQCFLVNVFHQHRSAVQRRLITDTAAHDTGTENSGLGNRMCLFGPALGFALEVLVIQEQANEVFCFNTTGQLTKGFGFHCQRLVKIFGHGAGDGGQNRRSRRITDVQALAQRLLQAFHRRRSGRVIVECGLLAETVSKVVTLTCHGFF